MSSDYVPIDCDVYERYELAIMHGERLFLRWHDANGVTHLERVTPFDLRARNGEEFLHAKTADGTVRVLRLDAVTEALFGE